EDFRGDDLQVFTVVVNRTAEGVGYVAGRIAVAAADRAFDIKARRHLDWIKAAKRRWERKFFLADGRGGKSILEHGSRQAREESTLNTSESSATTTLQPSI